MSILDETRFVERQKFFDGQRLFAPDLQGLEEFNREMRWLHNRSLHQPGIGNGFAISAGKGDREVTIAPGYAIDAMGREIVLTRAQVEPIPPVAGDGKGGSAFYDLTVAYPDDSELEEAETREGVCQTRGVVRLREEPIFCWVRLRFQDGRFTAENLKLSKQIEEGMRLVLARVEIFECKLAQKPSIAQRRSARPSSQPYVACGTTALDIWRPAESNGANNSIVADVDTSEAGFITTPCYSARVDRSEQAEISGSLVLPILVISDARPDRFTVHVTLFEVSTGAGANLFSATALMTSSLLAPKRGLNLAAISNAESVLARAAASIGDPLKYANENQWRVVWMGVED